MDHRCHTTIRKSGLILQKKLYIVGGQLFRSSSIASLFSLFLAGQLEMSGETFF